MATEFFCPKCNSPNPKDTVFCGKCGTRVIQESAATPAADPLIGTFVGDRFLVHEKLGEGGMGVVYRAEQTAIKREVALKVLHSNLNQDESLFARFQNEAAACSRLNHPNTITIYDFGKTSLNSLYIAMEFIRGKSLDDEIRKEGALGVTRACHIANQICGSLQDAHSNSIVHRDLKPENVMLCERAGEKDVVKVLDFGIAKIMADDDSQDQRKALTKTGMVFGTPQYMSPEQIRGEKVDHRTDIYSLGVMVYQMLTGSLPFNAETPMGLLTKHLMEAPPALEPQGIPAAVAAVVMSSLEKEAAKRPSSMREFGQKLCQAAGLNFQGTAPQLAVAPSAKTVPQQAVGISSSDASRPANKPSVGYSAPQQRKGFPIVPVVVVVILLAGGGVAAWYFTAGPGGQSVVPQVPQTLAVVPPQIPSSIAQYGQQPPTVPTAVPTVPVGGQPTAANPTVEPLPSTPTLDTPSGGSTDKNSGSGSGKKPKTPDKLPDGVPDKLPDNAPGADLKCEFTNTANSELAKSVSGGLRKMEDKVRACAAVEKELKATFSFKVEKGATTVADVSPASAGSSNCAPKILEKAAFGAAAESGSGKAAFTFSTTSEKKTCKVHVAVSAKKPETTPDNKPDNKPDAKPDNKPDNKPPVNIPGVIKDIFKNKKGGKNP